MKNAITLIACVLTLHLVGQNKSHHFAQHQKSETGTVMKKQHMQKQNGSMPETVYWAETFANGIPTTWTNSGFDSSGAPNPSALWEYRGVNSTPNNTIGSRGAFGSSYGTIQSATTSDGFIIFDSDFLDNGGSAANMGLGVAPAPHVGTLTTDTINLSGLNHVGLRFNSYHRYFEGRALMALSTDGGLSWPDTIAIHANLTPNMTTQPNTLIELNVSNIVDGQQHVMLRFIFDGNYNDPSAAGNSGGYYFWMIDDIAFYMLPKHDLRFTTGNDKPAIDIHFGGNSEGGKYGSISKNYWNNQTRSMGFSANAYNFGWDSLANIYLHVQVLNHASSVIYNANSAPIATLVSLDTISAMVLNMGSNTFHPTQTGAYRAIFNVISDSTSIVYDTIFFNVSDSIMSLDFNSYQNAIGTPELGNDGCAIAMRLDLTDDAIMIGLRVGLSPGTMPGGIIEAVVFDTTGFSFTTGIPSSSLVAQSDPMQYPVITPADVAKGYCQFPIVDGINGYAILPTGSYYVAVYLYSIAGASPILLKNDQTIVQPELCHLMYNADSSKWYAGYQNSLALNSPLIQPILLGWQSIAEAKLFSAITLSPNPTHGDLKLSINNLKGAHAFVILDITGRELHSENHDVTAITELLLDLSRLPAGSYFLQVRNAQATASFPIIKQ